MAGRTSTKPGYLLVNGIAQTPPGVVIRRCYEPEIVASEDLIYILHRLLLDTVDEVSELPPAGLDSVPESTCLAPPPE